MTQTPLILSGLSQIADRYDAVFCDAWGVIHNGRALFPGVADALINFRRERGPVIILTNAPRLSDVIPAQLDRLGLPKEAYDDVVTSGDATRAAVIRHDASAFYRLGPMKDDTLFSSIGKEWVSFEEAEAILCTGPENDLEETPEDYRDMLSGAAARGLPMICANPDKVVKFGDRMIYCAGALADLYEELGGEVIMGGKPHAPIYALCREAAIDAGAPKEGRPLAIGDGLQTDILGANNQNIDVAFVADGIFAEDARGDEGRLDEERLGALLRQYGVHAQYGLEGLSW